MRSTKNICIIINHHDDIKLFSKNLLNKSDLYYKNYYVKLNLKNLNIKIKELKFKNFFNKKINFFLNFKSDWFRDENNKDYTLFEQKFSIGNIAKDYVTRDLFTFYKNYHLFLQLKKNYDKVFISSKETYYFKKFTNTSKKNFFYYKSRNSYIDIIERDVPTIFNYDLIKTKNYFYLFRALQKFFRFFISNKTLIFNDPSLKIFFKKKKILLLNSINIFKSFYFVKQKVIKKNLPNNFKQIIKKNLVKFDLPNDFLDVFTDHIHNKLRNNLNLFCTYYSMINEMINFYKPKTIIIPSIKTFHCLLAMYACVNQNVDVLLASDGSNLGIFKDMPFDKKFLKKNKISILAYSLEEEKYFKKIIDNENIKLFPLPLHLAFKKNLKKKYDIIVLDYLWSFNNNSINSKRDYSYKILNDILTTIDKTNKKNIAIKFKKTNSKLNFNYQEFIKTKVLKSFPKLNIDFLDGDFSETLNYANIFVGGISTSIIETFYAKKKYIIYLPDEVGYSDSFVNKTTIYINSKQIVRNLNQLKYEINSKEKIKLKKKINNNLANYYNLNNFFGINKKVIK
jgi:hypothetical protein